MAVPLGLLDLQGHYTVEREGLGYVTSTGLDASIDTSRLMSCIQQSGYNLTKDDAWIFRHLDSTLFSTDASSTKYTMMTTETYILLLLLLLFFSVLPNFTWLCFTSSQSFVEKVLSCAKSLLTISLHTVFDEGDANGTPEQLHQHYQRKFKRIHLEYIVKLLLHVVTNVTLTFPWALAYQTASRRHQILTKVGCCYRVKGTVEMEDISLNRLWWGQWILPLLMVVVGFLNYGWFMLYVKFGHPWRKLLIPDCQRIQEWKNLNLLNMVYEPCKERKVVRTDVRLYENCENGC